MYVRKLRRKCGVRGCTNTDTYAISHSSEAGNTVIICKSCLGKALSAIDDEPQVPEIRVPHNEAPPLFFNAKPRKAEPEATFADVIEAVADAVDATAAEEAEPDTEDSTATPPSDAPEFVCPHCGQVCKSELGLRSHINAKHKDLA